MLVLKLKCGESLSIGDGVEVTLVEVLANGVRLGFEADKSIPIVRHNAVVKEPKGEERA